MSDDPLVKCPKCKKRKLVRLISGAGLVFKGSGFYLTDYKQRGTSPGGGAAGKPESPGKGASAGEDASVSGTKREEGPAPAAASAKKEKQGKPRPGDRSTGGADRSSGKA